MRHRTSIDEGRTKRYHGSALSGLRPEGCNERLSESISMVAPHLESDLCAEGTCLAPPAKGKSEQATSGGRFSRGKHRTKFENNPVMYTDSTGLDPGDPPGLATLIGNAINNRVTAINEATGTVLADLYNRTGSRLGFEDRTDFGDQYAGLVDLVNSTETPAHPEGTPYIVGGLAVSACAVTTAAAVGAGPGVGRFLFGKGGLLNRGPNLRIGFGRKGGERVFRIAGDWVKKINSSGKIDLWKGGPL